MTTVLLIDDDERLAEPLAEYFQRFDLQLINATQPAEGLARLGQKGVSSCDFIKNHRRKALFRGFLGCVSHSSP